MTPEILDNILKLVWIGIGLQLFLLILAIRNSVKRFWEKIGYRLELAAEEFRKAMDDIEDIIAKGEKLSLEGERELRTNGFLKSIIKLFI